MREFCNEKLEIFWSEQFLQRVMSKLHNEQRVIFCKEQLLQQLTSDFLQVATSATSNERILQREASDFTTSNEQRVKRYASTRTFIKVPSLS